MRLLQNWSGGLLSRCALRALNRSFRPILILFLLVPPGGLSRLAAQDVISSNSSTENTLTSNSTSEDTVTRADVIVDGRTILQITDASSTSAVARADLINRRLERLIEREDDVPRFTEDQIVRNAGQPEIRLGGEPILTVTQADAEYNLTEARDLALLWGGKLSVAVVEARNTRANPLRGVGYLIRYSFRDLIQSIAVWLPRLAGAILVWIVFWLLARGVRWIVQTVTSRLPLDPNLRQLAVAVAFYGVWATGLVAILSTLGIDSTSIATAVGISGFVLGFAFKDILSHFFAGLMLLTSRQLHIGGQIVVGQYEGTVERIELRALHLRTYDNRLVIIPNGDVFTSAVMSNTALAYRRHEFFVGIAYEDNVAQAQQVALKAVLTTEGILEEPTPQVLVHELGASAVNLRILFYTSSLRDDTLKVTSECIRHVKEALEREGISIPLDSQNIYIRNLDDLKVFLRELLMHDDQNGTENKSRHDPPGHNRVSGVKKHGDSQSHAVKQPLQSGSNA